jgi:hypothetical protein
MASPTPSVRLRCPFVRCCGAPRTGADAAAAAAALCCRAKDDIESEYSRLQAQMADLDSKVAGVRVVHMHTTAGDGKRQGALPSR